MSMCTNPPPVDATLPLSIIVRSDTLQQNILFGKSFRKIQPKTKCDALICHPLYIGRIGLMLASLLQDQKKLLWVDKLFAGLFIGESLVFDR